MSTDLVEKSNCGEGSLDRISDIPDVLKEKILECLPLNEAVKTSELSQNWRRIWTGMKRLTFNFNTPFFERFGRLTEVRFTRIIERILLLHHGSLELFSIDIPRHFDLKSLYLNGLFVSLSRKKLQRLIINPCGWVKREFISIPPYLFDCLVLTHLGLINCALRPPPNFQGFHNLVMLLLYSTRIASKELSEFISHCPIIKTLFLYGILECCYEPLIISAQSVRDLHIKDFISGMIILKNAPCLTLVTLECLKDTPLVLHRKAYTMFELLCSLLAVKELTFDLPLLEPFNGYCPSILKNDFVALKTLTLGRVTICSQDDIMFIFCLLRSSPNLKTLNISIKYIGHNDEEDEASLKCLEVERIKGYNLSQLLNVKIAGLIGLRCETALVNIILSSCPLLKTLRLELSWGITIEKEAKMAWELNRCRRLSSDVELMYYNSKSQL
ncbi:unnamed protein product [Rhodiola kirilowii]